jgi:hypothetical protein
MEAAVWLLGTRYNDRLTLEALAYLILRPRAGPADVMAMAQENSS